MPSGMLYKPTFLQYANAKLRADFFVSFKNLILTIDKPLLFWPSKLSHLKSTTWPLSINLTFLKQKAEALFTSRMPEVCHSRWTSRHIELFLILGRIPKRNWFNSPVTFIFTIEFDCVRMKKFCAEQEGWWVVGSYCLMFWKKEAQGLWRSAWPFARWLDLSLKCVISRQNDSLHSTIIIHCHIHHKFGWNWMKLWEWRFENLTSFFKMHRMTPKWRLTIKQEKYPLHRVLKTLSPYFYRFCSIISRVFIFRNTRHEGFTSNSNVKIWSATDSNSFYSPMAPNILMKFD